MRRALAVNPFRGLLFYLAMKPAISTDFLFALCMSLLSALCRWCSSSEIRCCHLNIGLEGHMAPAVID